MMDRDRESLAEREARLNEAALALIGLTPGDLPAIVRFDGLLNAYVAGATPESEDGSRVARAAALVAGVIVGESRLEEVVDPVAELLEEAMNLLDGPPAASPAAEEAPLPVAAPPAPEAEAEIATAILAPPLALVGAATDAADSPLSERVPEDADLLPDFISESVEYLEAAEGALLALEADPTDADLSLQASDLLKAVVQALRGQEPGEAVPLPADYPRVLAILAAPDEVIAAGAVPPAPAAAAAPAGDDGAGAAEAEGAPAAPAASGAAKRPAAENEAELSVRVRTDRLDRLVDLVGELVVAQAMVIQDPHVARSDGPDLQKKIVQAGKIVRDLQDLSMALRMVPFRPVFQKIARVVRDVARKSGKEVDFVTEGEDTEIDRSMVDIIADPLVHMIRNAVDHGLELPAEREEAGKDARGTLRLSAYQQGGGVVVELSDDGRGLDRERILRKAIDKGLVEPERTLSDSEVYALIFAPGFSTAEKVTDLSGRGVGMDVVRRNVESLHGRIEIDSEPGRGTRFRMILPLTLAITDGMLIRVGTERYIVPTVSIERSLRPEPETLSSVHGKGEMVLLHGRVIPIVRLHEVFSVSEATKDPTEALLMVIGEGTARVALLVDELLGQQQFVAKPLGDGVGRVEGLAGGAVLGDGTVGLILDCAELVALARGRVGAEARVA